MSDLASTRTSQRRVTDVHDDEGNTLAPLEDDVESVGANASTSSIHGVGRYVSLWPHFPTREVTVVSQWSFGWLGGGVNLDAPPVPATVATPDNITVRRVLPLPCVLARARPQLPCSHIVGLFLVVGAKK